MKLGDRVAFTYRGKPPYNGERITGEVVMIDEPQGMVLVYRDNPWRLADAVATWLADYEVEPLSSNDAPPKE